MWLLSYILTLEIRWQQNVSAKQILELFGGELNFWPEEEEGGAAKVTTYSEVSNWLEIKIRISIKYEQIKDKSEVELVGNHVNIRNQLFHKFL